VECCFCRTLTVLRTSGTRLLEPPLSCLMQLPSCFVYSHGCNDRLLTSLYPRSEMVLENDVSNFIELVESRHLAVLEL